MGGGGREHALAWKLAQSPSLTKLWASPGNPGIADHAELIALDLKNHKSVVDFCIAHGIDLVVVGPEAPLVDGIADSLRSGGIAVFGPSRAAAQLEGSKGFTKELCSAANIPTAAYERYNDRDLAKAGLTDFGLPVVVKADGLAAGKGVTVATTMAEAEAALDAIFAEQGASVVIEDFLEGEEVSLFALSDGATVCAFGTAQDHKRIGEGDTGPNTGGMGAYSPATVLTPDLEARAMAEIVQPTVEAMRNAGMPFVGVLYAGLMLTAEGPKLIEYNVRFGDPETQVLMPRFTGDLASLFLSVATGKLDPISAQSFNTSVSMAVVLAAAGYPGAYTSGDVISGVSSADAIGKTFLAGVEQKDDEIFASGGRVLAVTGSGADIIIAQANAYAALKEISFSNGQFRNDIGWREVKRMRL